MCCKHHHSSDVGKNSQRLLLTVTTVSLFFLSFFFLLLFCLSAPSFFRALVLRYVGPDFAQEESAERETFSRCQDRGLHSHHCPDCCKISRRILICAQQLAFQLTVPRPSAVEFSRLCLPSGSDRDSRGSRGSVPLDRVQHLLHPERSGCCALGGWWAAKRAENS